MDGTAFFFNLIFPLSVTDHSSGLKCTLHRKELLDGSQSALATRCCQSFLSFGSRGKHFIIYPFSLRLWHPTAAQPGIFDHPHMKMNLQIKNNGETALLPPSYDRISIKSQHRARRASSNHDDTTPKLCRDFSCTFCTTCPPSFSSLPRARHAPIRTTSAPKVHLNEQIFLFYRVVRDIFLFFLSFFLLLIFIPFYRTEIPKEPKRLVHCSRIARYLEHSRKRKTEKITEKVQRKRSRTGKEETCLHYAYILPFVRASYPSYAEHTHIKLTHTHPHTHTYIYMIYI